MRDPVTLSTGITYDRESIEKWLSNKKNITKQTLSDIELIPNHTLRRLIQSWCTINAPLGFERYPTPRLPISKSQILKLLQDSKSPHLQMKCLNRLKTIVLESDMNKRSVGAAEYLANYVIENPRSDVTSSSPAEDEALSILYHLRLSQTGLKALFGKNGEFVEALTSVMQRSAEDESRTYAILLILVFLQVGKLCFLLQVDYCGSKTSERAREILKLHSRAWKNSSCNYTIQFGFFLSVLVHRNQVVQLYKVFNFIQSFLI